jgi:hypothetical protein
VVTGSTDAHNTGRVVAVFTKETRWEKRFKGRFNILNILCNETKETF